MQISFRWLKRLAVGLIVIGLASCGETPVVDTKPAPLGDFKLGFAVVVAKNAQKGPLSRDATPEEWVAMIKPEIERIYSVYEGDRFYHISITVEGYVLAIPGIPLVASPKSGVVVSLNVWDDARQVRILEENKQFTVLEAISAKSMFGSGLTQSSEEQMASLTKSIMKQVQAYLKKNADAFRPDSPIAEPKDS